MSEKKQVIIHNVGDLPDEIVIKQAVPKISGGVHIKYPTNYIFTLKRQEKVDKNGK